MKITNICLISAQIFAKLDVKTYNSEFTVATSVFWGFKWLNQANIDIFILAPLYDLNVSSVHIPMAYDFQNIIVAT